MRFKAKAILEVEKEWELESDSMKDADKRVGDLINAMEVMYGAVMTYSEVGPVEDEE